ncbi:MAG: response regulator [Pseudomonadota bacterium]|nr:response regulator [Pseudomonadota bacterium]
MLRGKHIVVIDDTESIRQFLRFSLEAYGAAVQVTATAAAGLACCEQAPPDLAVLDIGLPDNEGLNILPRLKRLGKHHALPVVVLTVRKDQDSMERAKILGANAYLTKPCFVEDVIEVISRLLAEKHAPHLSLVMPDTPPRPGPQDMLLSKGT